MVDVKKQRREISKLIGHSFRANAVTGVSFRIVGRREAEKVVGGGEIAPAFVHPGVKVLFLVDEELENISMEDLFMLVNHELGHLSITPINPKGNYFEALYIVDNILHRRDGALPAVFGPNGNFLNMLQDTLLNIVQCFDDKKLNIGIYKNWYAKGLVSMYEQFIRNASGPVTMRSGFHLLLSRDAGKVALGRSAEYGDVVREIRDLGITRYMKDEEYFPRWGEYIKILMREGMSFGI